MSDFNLMKRIWQFAKKYKWFFLGSYMVLLIELALGQLLPVLLGNIVNAALYTGNISLFLNASFYYAFICLGYALCGYTQLQLWQRVHNRYVYDIRVSCYRKVLHLQAKILADIKTGDIIQTINDDTAQFHHMIQRYIMRVINSGIGTVVSLVIAATMKWEIALFMGVVIPVSAFISRYIEANMQKSSMEARAKQGVHAAWTMEILKGMREIKMFAAEKTVLRLFMIKNHDIVEAVRKRDSMEFKAIELINGIYFVADIIFYIICAIYVMNGSINIGQYVALASYFTMITRNFKKVLYGNVGYQKRKTCVEHVLKLLDLDEEEETGLSPLVVSEGRIQIQDLSFSYESAKEILMDISLDIKPGEKLGIVGPSGVGKSTIVGLLMKFYSPQKGEILIDGMNIKECSHRSVRQVIGVVSQESVIFAATVRDNITFGYPASDELLWDILEKVDLRKKVEHFPQGLDTLLESDGLCMSGGQNQRLCIARLFFRNPRIIILDEATSALDQESECFVQKALRALTEGRTTIMISHRYSALIHTDRILVLHEGRQVGCDEYKRLLSENQYFTEMFAKQEASI